MERKDDRIVMLPECGEEVLSKLCREGHLLKVSNLNVGSAIVGAVSRKGGPVPQDVIDHSGGKYQMTAIVDGNLVRKYITEKEYIKFLSLADDSQKLKMFNTLFGVNNSVKVSDKDLKKDWWQQNLSNPSAMVSANFNLFDADLAMQQVAKQLKR